MRKHSQILIIGAAITLSAFADQQLEIKKYRFQHHSKQQFDRLVLEFGSKGTLTPKTKVTPSGNGKEYFLTVEHATLVGAIPESPINDTYERKSHYLGPISISTDSPQNGFSIRTFKKGGDNEVDAFWLSNPTRLIIDAYPSNSPRAQSREVLVAENSSRKVASAPKPAPKIHSRDVYCFPISAQVKARVGYEKGASFSSVQTVVANTPEPSPGDDIICFPGNLRVAPSLTFYGGEFSFPQYTPVPKQSSLIPTPAVQPKPVLATPVPVAPPPKKTLEERINAEADDALSLDDEEFDMPTSNRRMPSSGPESFNRNSPPPTLGKSLLPPLPGGGGGAKAVPAKPATLASPSSLLPPLKK